MDITGRPGLVYLLQRVINNSHDNNNDGDGLNNDEDEEINLIIEDDGSLVPRHPYLEPYVTMEHTTTIGCDSMDIEEQEIDIEIQEYDIDLDIDLDNSYNILDENFNSYDPGMLDDEPSDDNDDETDDGAEEQNMPHRMPIVGEGDFTVYANGLERRNRPMHYEVNPYNYRNIHGDVDSFHRFSATSHINLIGVNREVQYPQPALHQTYQPFGYIPFHYNHRMPYWLETNSSSRTSQDAGSQSQLSSTGSQRSERSQGTAPEVVARRQRNLFTSTCSLPLGQSLRQFH